MNQLVPSRLLAFIGGGQMAAALVGGLIRASWPANSIIVVEPNEGQRTNLEAGLGVRTLPRATHELKMADAVIWAVKPQVLREAVRLTLPFLGTPLHISIAAGVRLQDLATWVASRRVVRVMPNTAALVSSGVSGSAALEGVDDDDRALTGEILAATGHSFWVDSDERIDAVTAVSGSGPAYVFHFLEAFQRAAQAMGFSQAKAREIVLKTATGAIQLALAGDTSFATLRQNVTSKRGTTEAGIAVLDEKLVSDALLGAVQAAYERSGELSRELGHLIQD